MSDGEGPAPIFEERQRFRSKPLVGLVVALAAWAWLALAISVRSDDRSWPLWWSWAIAVVFGMGLPWFLWALELRTAVTGDGLDVRFAPRIGGHRFPVAAIASACAVTYHPLKEFGGWGVRFGARGARAYNVSGASGVEVIDTDGTRWVIGSRRATELAAAIAGLGIPPPAAAEGG